MYNMMRYWKTIWDNILSLSGDFTGLSIQLTRECEALVRVSTGQKRL